MATEFQISQGVCQSLEISMTSSSCRFQGQTVHKEIILNKTQLIVSQSASLTSMLAMTSLFFCSDISPKLPLKAMANCHITSMHAAPHVDANRVDLDNHLAPQT